MPHFASLDGHYHPLVIRRAVRTWKVGVADAVRMLDHQESRELETREGHQGFWRQTDNGPVWCRAIDTLVVEPVEIYAPLRSNIRSE